MDNVLEDVDMTQTTCTIPGCDKPTRSKVAQWCKMHYHRWYRHGDPALVATGRSTRDNASRYRLVDRPDHPVAGDCGKAYEHRIVLFDLIGPGRHSCHWCEKPVFWERPSTHADGLQVDHLNARRDDNRPENLVPSCMDCNTGRGAQARHDRLVALGFWSRNDTVAQLRHGHRKPRVEDHV